MPRAKKTGTEEEPKKRVSRKKAEEETVDTEVVEAVSDEESVDYDGMEYNVAEDKDAVEEDDSDIEIPDTGEEPEEEAEPVEENSSEEVAPRQRRERPEGMRGAIAAGRRSRKRLYNEGAVVTHEGVVRLNRQNSKRHKEYMDLVNSARSGKTLSGTLIQSYNASNGDIMGSVSYGDNFFINIPVEALCDITLQPQAIQDALHIGERNLTAEQRDQRTAAQQAIVQARIGASITFRVLEVNEATGTGFGDHIKAMMREAREYYSPNGKGRNGQPMITPGVAAEAQIMQVNRIGVWVEAFGAEGFIPAVEMDWFRRSDFSEIYSPGDMLTVKNGKKGVKILTINSHRYDYYGRTASIVNIGASIRQMEVFPNQKHFDKIEVGTKGLAEVTQITESGIFVIYGGKVLVLCAPLEDGQVEVHDRVQVKILDKHEDSFLFYGRVNRIISRAM